MKYYEHLTNSDFDNEIWKHIDEYQNYMVSNIGRVKSLKYNNTEKEQLLKPRIDTYGYLVITLCKNGKVKSIRVHRLVASAFIDNPESKPQVNHKNGTKTDNRFDNLEWVSAKENINHAWDNGLFENLRIANIGKNNGRRKLTDEDCEQIRIKYSNENITQRELAKEFGCHHAYISSIINNKKRKNIIKMVENNS